MYQDITELFCHINDFCKDIEKNEKAKTLVNIKKQQEFLLYQKFK